MCCVDNLLQIPLILFWTTAAGIRALVSTSVLFKVARISRNITLCHIIDVRVVVVRPMPPP